jgi:hypothetical protein
MDSRPVMPSACWSVVLNVLDEAPSDEERQQSLDGCIDLLRCTKDRL